jgi:hypothetical protein
VAAAAVRHSDEGKKKQRKKRKKKEVISDWQSATITDICWNCNEHTITRNTAESHNFC